MGEERVWMELGCVLSYRVVSCRIVNKTLRQASKQAGRQADKASKENTTAEISGIRGGGKQPCYPRK